MGALFQKVGLDQKLSQIIVEKIEDLIRSKKIVAGQKLPTEKEMCEMFGVSRTALREALQMLSAKGLVSIRKGSGIYVNEYSSETATDFISLYLETNFEPDAVLHVVQVRQLLEPQIARLAALHRTEEHLKLLQKKLDAFASLKKSNVKRLGQLDRQFHLLLAQATGNPLIPVITDPIFRLMPKIRTLVYAKIDQAESEALKFHQKIFDRVKDGDADGAYEMMKLHLEIAEQHSREIIK